MNFTRRPLKDFTSTFGSRRKIPRIMSSRSSTVKRGDFSVLMSTATSTRSKMWQPLRIRSTWPFVMGSNVPG
jgi:hypothetical protein